MNICQIWTGFSPVGRGSGPLELETIETITIMKFGGAKWGEIVHWGAVGGAHGDPGGR